MAAAAVLALFFFQSFAQSVSAGETCLAEQEPNDSPETATPVSDQFCATGSMSSADQEILVWTLDAESAKHPWTLHIDGPRGVESRIQIHHLDEPGNAENPAVVGEELLSIATPTDTGNVERSNVFLAAGTWLIGLSSSSDTPVDYQLRVSKEEPPPDTGATNLTAAAAKPEPATFTTTGVITNKEVWYAWTLTAADARKQWTLTAAAPLGVPVGLELQTSDGKPLLTSTRLTAGQLVLPDIGLPAATYRVRLAAELEGNFPFALSAASQGPRSPIREDEPNDSPLTARPLTFGQAMAGHISQPGDVDTFVLPLAGTEGKLFGLDLHGDSKLSKRLCIGGADGVTLQCREGATPSLSDIAITDKTRFVTVSGSADAKAGYQLTVRAASTAAPGSEAEPNDTAQQANPLAAPSMKGRFPGEDVDVFGFSVADDKVRHFSVTGDGVNSMEVLDGQGQSSARVERTKDASGQPVAGPLDISGLALPPGRYTVALAGSKGEYTLVTDQSAAPAVSGAVAEIEPNDSWEQAQGLSEGKPVSAKTESFDSPDVYRISLAREQGIKLSIDPDKTCPLAVKIEWESDLGTHRVLHAGGASASYLGRLEAGNYQLTVRPDMGCSGTTAYTIGYTDAPDVPKDGDVEPNDTFALARPLPPNLEVSGTVGEYDDDDWFRLPAVSADTEVTISATGGVKLSLTDGKPTSSEIMGQPSEIASGYSGQPLKGSVPAGQAGAIHVTGSGEYALKVEIAGVQPSPTAAATGALLTMKLALNDTAIAAYWHRGQMLTGALTLSNDGGAPVDAQLSASANQPGWRINLPDHVTVGARGSQSVPVSIEIEPDPFAMRAVRIAVTAKNGNSLLGTASTDVAVDALAPPLGDHLAFGLPPEILGGFNVAWSALGGTLQPSDGITEDEHPETINDGLGSNAGFAGDAGSLPITLTIKFAGDTGWPIRGMTLNPQTPGLWPTEYAKDFELWLSEDGQNFHKLLTGQLSPDAGEQAFILPETTKAKAAQLRILSNANGNTGHVGISEWKVITDPSASIGAELDLADTGRGGHIVWSEPLISDQPRVVRDVLEAGGDGPIAPASAGTRPQFTLGFNEDRAAQITRIEWTDSAQREDAVLFPSVLVEASSETPIGPWRSLGEWTLERDPEGRATKSFDKPVWARFLRFSIPQPLTADEKLQFPTALHVYERATDANYRSVLGEWGEYTPIGFYELNLPPTSVTPAKVDDHLTRDTAAMLEMGQPASGRVEIGRREDWYKVVQPANRDLLEVTLNGEPNVGVDVTLLNEAGEVLPLNESGSSPKEAKFEGRVAPGHTYYLHVVQPPHSVVIAYDTSGSLLQFIPMIADALGVFAQGVAAGQEAVMFLPFDSPPMLPTFTDQKLVLAQALAKDPRASTTSGLEDTAITAMRALAARRGTRAILLITDAASSSTAAATDMWKMLEQTRPRIFAAHTGSFDDPEHEKQVMEDLSLANGGHYVSARSQPELDVAFDRVAAYLRRPAEYNIVVNASSAAPPEPGTLSVIAGKTNVTPNPETGVQPHTNRQNVEIVLDASGSMLARIGDRRKIEIARQSLVKLIDEDLHPEDPVAFRVFGNDRPGSCETSLIQPLSPLDPNAMKSIINPIMPQNLARTPIAASLTQVGNDLAAAEGQKVVVLITDGEETCGGDPRAAIAALAAADISVRINIVGFQLDDAALKGEFSEWARIGRGRYFDVVKPDQLYQAVKAATEIPFEVTDDKGAKVGSGQVGGAPLTLPAGTYSVKIELTPPRTVEGVVVKERQATQIEAGAL